MSITTYTRSDWGARSPAGTPVQLPKGDINEIVVHYSSMDGERRLNHSDCASTVRSIQSYHQGTKGWNDIAYNWLVCQHGGVFEGRGWGVMSAATYEHNSHTQAVCFLGGDVENRDDVGVEGREALTHVIREFHKKMGLTKGVVGHRDRVNTSCPGDELYSWITAEGWRVLDPAKQPWPVPVPKWFWLWAKWRRSRYAYANVAAWRKAKPKSAPVRIPDWAWVRLAAMTPKAG